MLSMLGAGMLLSPELFIDSLVCTDCIKQSAYQATVTSNISPIPPATMDMFLGSQLHLSRWASAAVHVHFPSVRYNVTLPCT